MKAGRRGTLATAAAAGLVASALLSTSPDAAGKRAAKRLFVTADRCQACHNGLMTPAGDDASIGVDWRSSMMANAARDPYWQAAVQREVTDHPTARAAIEDECSKCHMPMARLEAHHNGGEGQIFAHLPIGQGATRLDLLAADGVSCSLCHQITPSRFGQRSSFVAGFEVDTRRPLGSRTVFGPFEVDAGRAHVMRSASTMLPTAGTHLQQSEMCATCHTLFTHSLDAAGKVVGELPEQVPFLEWRHSAYRTTRSCQSCHMPTPTGTMPISSVVGQPREKFSRHAFRGGNFFMLRMLSRYGGQLGVTALPQDLTASALRTSQHLQSSAADIAVSCAPISGGKLEAVVSVKNLAGHKLPTAYPSRRAWIRLEVLDAMGVPLFESGAFTPSGAISGNDNDADPARYEPHYDRIEKPDQVQIYEAILADPGGKVTTGLLTATSYVKDNRVLPRGFDKTTASKDVAVNGRASSDDSFRGGSDEIRYVVEVGKAPAPLQVRASLWYQPIGYRWAHNLGTVQAAETARFVSLYQSMSFSSAVRLARAEATAQRSD